MIPTMQIDFSQSTIGKSGNRGNRRGEIIPREFSLPPIGRRENSRENSTASGREKMGIVKARNSATSPALSAINTNFPHSEPILGATKTQS
ncbi:MAG: hypothetical protein ACI9R3_004514 [Verrucomicrobiales bacterium]|jgi:hypothetical protein